MFGYNLIFMYFCNAINLMKGGCNHMYFKKQS